MKNILRENMRRFGTKNLLTEDDQGTYEIGGLIVKALLYISTTSEGYERLVFQAKHTNTDYATTDPEAVCKLLVREKYPAEAVEGGEAAYIIVSLACTSGKDFDAGTKDAPGKGKVDTNLEQTIEDVITFRGASELFTIIKK